MSKDRVLAEVLHGEAKGRHGDYYQSPGYYLRLYRQRADMTQAELADRTGILQHHLSEIENNKRVLGKANAMKLGEALDFDYRRVL
ncbi:MAG: helix-turn-helix transcriptional regulator [Gammaproteobacteria bacterium]|nr:helix-turn-helix transcriptional regulator [Gammaproteobacteria bacterium]